MAPDGVPPSCVECRGGWEVSVEIETTDQRIMEVLAHQEKCMKKAIHEGYMLQLNDIEQEQLQTLKTLQREASRFQQIIDLKQTRGGAVSLRELAAIEGEASGDEEEEGGDEQGGWTALDDEADPDQAPRFLCFASDSLV
jgi:hypothetical protein